MTCAVANFFETVRQSQNGPVASSILTAKPVAAKLVHARHGGQGQARVALVAGTRPEIIKLAPVYHALKAGPLDVQFITTGQHLEMADQALAAFNITPDVKLNCLGGATTLAATQAHMMLALSDLFTNARPDLIVVQGDTSSAFTGALVGFDMEIPVAHVEAGLTSTRRYDPYPEEMLRTLIREMASMHFAPTEQAFRHLQEAKVPAAGLHLSGNTVVDAAQCIAATQRDCPTVLKGIDPETRIVLVTTHRRESWGAGIENICAAVAKLALTHPEVEFVWPVHLNPRVAETVRRTMSDFSNVRLTEPLGYKDFVGVLARATLALTDSGGVQEEAPSFGVPVLVMRDVTERPEGIEAGLARLIGKDSARIFDETHALLTDETKRLAMTKAKNPFGDGRSGPRIAQVIEQALATEHIATAQATAA